MNYRITELPGRSSNELLLNKSGNMMYVANAGDNSVSVINLTTKKKFWKVLNCTLSQCTNWLHQQWSGIVTGSKSLYIANADNNCLAVFDVSHRVLLNPRFYSGRLVSHEYKTIGKKIFAKVTVKVSLLSQPIWPRPDASTG